MTPIAEATPTQLRLHSQAVARRERFFRPQEPVIVPAQIPMPGIVATCIDQVIGGIVHDVAEVSGICGEHILGDMPDGRVGEARSLAMALCIRRAKFQIQDIADHFGVPIRAVQQSVYVLDPILVDRGISMRTPLALSLPVIWRDWIEYEDRRKSAPSVREIQKACSVVWDVAVKDIICDCRMTFIIPARHAAMALSKRLTMYGYAEIGRRFGGRDHTTIVHAVEKYKPIIAAIDNRPEIPGDPLSWAAAVRCEAGK